jgi:hypothetical protein
MEIIPDWIDLCSILNLFVMIFLLMEIKQITNRSSAGQGGFFYQIKLVRDDVMSYIIM